VTDEQFADYYARYFQTIKSFFLAKGCRNEEALDLAQDTFFQAHRKRDQFKGRFFIAWLRSIAENAWKNELRRRGTKKRKATIQPIFEDTIPSKVSEDPLRTIINRETMSKVTDIVHGLPPRMRHCLHLRIIQQRKYEEIATVLGISIDTVKSQLSKARTRIRDAFSDSEARQ